MRKIYVIRYYLVLMVREFFRERNIRLKYVIKFNVCWVRGGIFGIRNGIWKWVGIKLVLEIEKNIMYNVIVL